MSIVVIGIGNILFADEGIGIYASSYIAQNYDYDESVTIIDGGTLGFKLMTYYQSYDDVLILDTVSIEDKVGSIYNLPAQELLDLGSYRKTAHEVEVIEMLEICSMLETMADVSIIGVVPQDIESVSISLTDSIRDIFASYVDVIIAQIHKSGYKITPKANMITLDDVISSYANPKAGE